jgi:phosphatidylserine/phosphatidylglycerophosphate/cardiolipin synthase-like enzyme
VQRLAKAGIPVRFLQTNRDSDEKLHAKWAVFDQKNLLMGSANWSNAGLLCNRKKENAADSPPPSALESEDNPEGARPENSYPARLSKSNHEVALLMESPKLSKTFSQQFRQDWRNTFPILMKSEEEGRWKAIAPYNNIRFLPQRKPPSTGTLPAVNL